MRKQWDWFRAQCEEHNWPWLIFAGVLLVLANITDGRFHA